MGGQPRAPINEGVLALSILDNDRLTALKETLPFGFAAQLQKGVIGGEQEEEDGFDIARAKVMIAALEAIKTRAELELPKLRKRMAKSRRYRLWAQIASVICTSGVLSTLAIGNQPAAVVSAFLALFSSVGIVLAEHGERLLKESDGDVFFAYEDASIALYKAGLSLDEISLLVKYDAAPGELQNAIEKANQICHDLHKLITKWSV